MAHCKRRAALNALLQFRSAATLRRQVYQLMQLGIRASLATTPIRSAPSAPVLDNAVSTGTNRSEAG